MDGLPRAAVGRVLAALALGALAALSGCRKADESPAGPVGPPPMPEAERARGLEACRSYAERVCRCARTDESLADECSMAGSRPSALEAGLRLVDEGQGKFAVSAQVATQTNARRIINRCFEADAKLDPATCPRKAPEVKSEPNSDSGGPAGEPEPGADPAAPAAANE